jgi:hypothetical protein
MAQEAGLIFGASFAESFLVQYPEVLEADSRMVAVRVRALCEVVGNQKATLLIHDTPRYLTAQTFALLELGTVLSKEECALVDKRLSKLADSASGKDRRIKARVKGNKIAVAS